MAAAIMIMKMSDSLVSNRFKDGGGTGRSPAPALLSPTSTPATLVINPIISKQPLATASNPTIHVPGIEWSGLSRQAPPSTMAVIPAARNSSPTPGFPPGNVEKNGIFFFHPFTSFLIRLLSQCSEDSVVQVRLFLRWPIIEERL
jgi:hypothetical protein